MVKIFYSCQGKEKGLDNGWCLVEWVTETKILCQVVKNQPFNNLYPAGQANAEARSVSFTFSLIFLIHIFDLIPKGILFFFLLSALFSSSLQPVGSSYYSGT